MATTKLLVALLWIALLLQSCVTVDDRGSDCGGNHRLRITDIDMSPDPIAEGQRVNRLVVRLRADGNGECRTVIRVREQGDRELIAQERVYRLHPGTNEIVIEPRERYRFSRNEHCFVVLADIGGTAREVDAARRFCARQTSGRRWTMK